MSQSNVNVISMTFQFYMGKVSGETTNSIFSLLCPDSSTVSDCIISIWTMALQVPSHSISQYLMST